MKIPWVWLLLLLLCLSACRSDDPQGTAPVESEAYIENKGSDTVVNLALAWAERYQNLHPEVRISVTGGGSGTGIAALINGTVDIANASRQISEEEIQVAESNGVHPVEFVIARDAIGVIVNRSNPIERLTLRQVSDLYSGRIDNWKELGGEDRPIVRLSRETNSGTHVYFLEAVLRLGDPDDSTIFSADTLLLPSSEGIISEVRDNPNAVGYDGLGYITEEVKVLAIAREPDAGSPAEYVLPSIETVNTGTYPIARDLYMYTDGEPTGLVKDYLDWILSPEAQDIVRELGFVPVGVPEGALFRAALDSSAALASFRVKPRAHGSAP